MQPILAQPKERLRAVLEQIDEHGYSAYKEIEGQYDFGSFALLIDHVQGDPFAAPSRVRVRVPRRTAGIPLELYDTRVRRIALEDYLLRGFGRAIDNLVGDHREGYHGSGKSGLISVERPGQEVLERSGCLIQPDGVEVRLVVGLPARGRQVLGREAGEILLREIPSLVAAALVYGNLNARELIAFINAVEDAEALRGLLPARGLIAFVADGAILPRRSGVDDRPLDRPAAIPFESPASLAVEFDLPNAGRVRGMGVPIGVTLIVGGGYHGKSTLLDAVARGVYDHVPGDGRELVVTVAEAVKIRAEDGRYVANVDIRPFIGDLPYGKDTSGFSSLNASGSTSQAANIVEAVEAGAGVLMLDEDTSATNFLIRDLRMQLLVAKEKEPITPFVDRVRDLAKRGVSTIMVLGGSGDYFDVADLVIMMDAYRPMDVTSRVREIVGAHPTGRQREVAGSWPRERPRAPLPESFDPSWGRREVRIDARGRERITFGTSDIDLSALEQLVDAAQTRCIADTLHYLSVRYADGKRSIREILTWVENDFDTWGLDVAGPFARGDYARPRRFEVAAALNRLCTLRVVQKAGDGGAREPTMPTRR